MVIANAMTVDVEDYFHVSAFASVIKPSDWDDFPCRVEANTDRLLGIFDDAGIEATFFVLGWVAERYPTLIRRIAEAGHEIASHGLTHQLVYDQTPSTFREETRKGKEILEDLVHKPVLGYRAASYSITSKSLWALDILADLGFQYDSSIFPVRHDRYGMPGEPRWPYRKATPGGGELIEFPLSTLDVGGYRLPVAGGGYFRLFPYALTKHAIRRTNHGAGNPFIFYLHPWELDPEQPRVRAGRLSRFRHYLNLGKTQGRLRRLLRDFRFTTAAGALSDAGFSVEKEGQPQCVASNSL